MSSERQPLLSNSSTSETDPPKLLVRPDIRTSPESTLVDVNSEEDGKDIHILSTKHIKHPTIYIKNLSTYSIRLLERNIIIQ